MYVWPSTPEGVTPAAEPRDGTTVLGESALGTGQAPIERVFLLANRGDGRKGPVTANAEAVAAIREADLIVIGPGSLYTSVMPNPLVPGIAEATYESRAPLKAFVCNVATEPGETDGYTACDFAHAVERHVEWPLFDHVVTNANRHARRPEVWKSQVVVPGERDEMPDGVRLVEEDVVDAGNALRHDPRKLAAQLLRLYESQRRASGAAHGSRSRTGDRSLVADEWRAGRA